MSALFATVLSLLAIFLILLVLVQRGRGGGLAGALGGMGGSSAFGAKAGDVFTRITVITAAVWIFVCLVALFWAEHRGDALGSDSSSATSSPLDILPQGPQPPTGGEKPATGQTGGAEKAPPSAPTGPLVVPPAPPAAETAPATSPPATESAPAGSSPPAEKDAVTPAESK